MPTHDVLILVLAAAAGLACGFLDNRRFVRSAVSLPVLMMIGLDPISANATNRIPVLIGANERHGDLLSRKRCCGNSRIQVRHARWPWRASSARRWPSGARRWVFLLLATIISAELVHVAVRYMFRHALTPTHPPPRAAPSSL